MMRFLVLFLAPVLCNAQICDTGPGQKRLAFLVANGKYDQLPSVSIALADSQVMKKALEGAGFRVTSIENATMPGLFDNDRKAFLEEVQPGDVVFFYYSGHLVQSPHGDTLVLPANFDPSADIDRQGFSLERFLEDLNETKPGLTIVMLEGPRKVGVPIPKVRGGLSTPDIRGMGKILFSMSARSKEWVETPSDSQVDVFTKAVAQRLATPGLPLTDLFEEAKQEVISSTNQRQIPSVEQIAATAFCFVAPEVKTELPVLRIETPPPVVNQVVVVETVPNNKRDHEEYVRIRAGSFKMGCVPKDPKCKPDEKPQHTVTIDKDFWMGRNEVEVGPFLRYLMDTKQRKAFTRRAPPDYHGWIINNLPMVNVTWKEAQDYCGWVGGRLPTEAEWEYAARAGGTDEIYPLNSENSREKANFDGKKGNDLYIGVAPVHSFDPSKFNLYDMAGNVWEWVFDWYSPTYYQESSLLNPQGPPSGKEHTLRGGSFESGWEDHLRLSLRWPKPENFEDFKTGFRCVLDDTPATHVLLGVN